jgi:hypothetical protein
MLPELCDGTVWSAADGRRISFHDPDLNPRKTPECSLADPFTAHKTWVNHRAMFGQTKRTTKATKPYQGVVQLCAC